MVVLLHLARKQYRLPLESEHVGQSKGERERERDWEEERSCSKSSRRSKKQTSNLVTVNVIVDDHTCNNNNNNNEEWMNRIICKCSIRPPQSIARHRNSFLLALRYATVCQCCIKTNWMLYCMMNHQNEFESRIRIRINRTSINKPCHHHTK